MEKAGLAARRAALRLLLEVTEEGRTLTEALPGATAQLPPADRARAQRLATETLRWADRADRLLGPHLRRRPAPFALNTLRLGAWEICAAGAAPHGVTDALVTLVREDRAAGGQAGLVNAVLRRLAEAGPAAWDAAPLPRLPRPLRRPLVAAWGAEAVAAMEAAHAAGAPLDLTPRDGEAAALAAATLGEALPTGSVRLPAGKQVSALPGFEDGAFWVQDAAAALPARLLGVGPGERVLDLCAAPGGKTLQLAATGAAVTALDISEDRLLRLHENLARCRLAAEVVAADALAWPAEGGFDAVLLDAPCSATGTLRRHPDLPHARKGAALEPLLDLQAALLDRAVAHLRPGGRLVFCTCSLFPEEGEAQVAAALARHPQLRRATLLPAGVPEAWLQDGVLRTRPDFWPERGGLDGFAMARLDLAG